MVTQAHHAPYPLNKSEFSVRAYSEEPGYVFAGFQDHRIDAKRRISTILFYPDHLELGFANSSVGAEDAAQIAELFETLIRSFDLQITSKSERTGGVGQYFLHVNDSKQRNYTDLIEYIKNNNTFADKSSENQFISLQRKRQR